MPLHPPECDQPAVEAMERGLHETEGKPWDELIELGRIVDEHPDYLCQPKIHKASQRRAKLTASVIQQILWSMQQEYVEPGESKAFRRRRNPTLKAVRKVRAVTCAERILRKPASRPASNRGRIYFLRRQSPYPAGSSPSRSLNSECAWPHLPRPGLMCWRSHRGIPNWTFPRARFTRGGHSPRPKPPGPAVRRSSRNRAEG